MWYKGIHQDGDGPEISGECKSRDPRAYLIHHFLEDIPAASLYEIETALKQLENNQASREGRVSAELQRVG
ncbi:hypothetical protein EVAR_81141_1 [Eumeta japonica]|uniref:Uncharacterized protein n=1 Tax=Eumeta variegata TaxID=151549 RepID=A0A4C1ULD2_EUMVA|nr:hypothetical protein EVAR_81141_1 [Eumeta japonica]